MNTTPRPARVTGSLLIAAAVIGAGVATAAPAAAKPGHSGDTTTVTAPTTTAEVNPGGRRGVTPNPVRFFLGFVSAPVDGILDRFTPPNPVTPPSPIFGGLDRFFDRFAPPNPCTGDRCTGGGGSTT
jgi:hypothetical protein